MPTNNNYPTPKKSPAASYDFLEEIRKVVRNLVNGKSNNTGEVTLAPSATSTVVKNILCNENSVVTMQALTSQAASLSPVYLVPGDKEFTIHHPLDISTTMVFRYVVTG